MREGTAETHTVVRLQTHGNLRLTLEPADEGVNRPSVGNWVVFGVMGRSRRLRGGPRISSPAVDLGVTLSPGT